MTVFDFSFIPETQLPEIRQQGRAVYGKMVAWGRVARCEEEKRQKGQGPGRREPEAGQYPAHFVQLTDIIYWTDLPVHASKSPGTKGRPAN